MRLSGQQGGRIGVEAGCMARFSCEQDTAQIAAGGKSRDQVRPGNRRQFLSGMGIAAARNLQCAFVHVHRFTTAPVKIG